MDPREEDVLQECEAQENSYDQLELKNSHFLDETFEVGLQWGFVVTDFRSGWLDLGTAFLALIVLLLGLTPAMMGVGSVKLETTFAALGLLLAGFVVWASFSVLGQVRAVALRFGTIIEYTFLTKWFNKGRERTVADLSDIIAVYLAPKVDLWSHYHNWVYPVKVLTKDGRSITLCNQLIASDREYLAIPMATRLAELLGCDLHIPAEREPVKVVRRGGAFAFEPKDQDLGIVGRLVAGSAVAALVCGLWKLWMMV